MQPPDLPLDACGFHLAGAALADGTDDELRALGEQVALGLLGSPALSVAPREALTCAIDRARRLLFDAELPTPEFSTCLARLDGLRARVADQLTALAKLTAAQIEQRLRDTLIRDASYAAVWHGGLTSF
jgi:nucleotide-binding universal stress UspA family protein